MLKVVRSEVISLVKKVIATKNAPGGELAGLLSQGIQAGDFLFLCGQIGKDPKTGKMVEGIQEQTRQAIQNMKTILEAAGMSLKNVVKVVVFLNDLADYGEMNKAYMPFFREDPPARSCVETKLLKGLLVELDATAYGKA